MSFDLLYPEDRVPKYCRKCRSELVEKLYSVGFNPYSGVESIAKFFVCPDAQLNYGEHDSWKIMEESLGGTENGKTLAKARA